MSQIYGKKFNYLWVAELQNGSRSIKVANKAFKLASEGVNVERNKKRYAEFIEKSMNPTNNIHFHMLVDRGYNVQLINKLWLTCLENQGARRMNEKGVEFNPVDVKPVKNFDKMKMYMTKYITKSDCELKGALWNCSNTVSAFATSMSDCLMLPESVANNYFYVKYTKKVGEVVKTFINITKKVFDGMTAYFFDRPTNWLIKKLQPLILFNLRLRYPDRYPSPTPLYLGSVLEFLQKCNQVNNINV